MPQSYDLASRRTMVVGGSRGIGASVVNSLIQRGSQVVAVARSREALIRVEESTGAKYVVADISVADEAMASVHSAADILGGLDSVVLTAASLRLGPIVGGDYGDWKHMFDTNVLGPLCIAREAVPVIQGQRDPVIVFVGSLSAYRVKNRSTGVYAATKFALRAATEALRIELAEDRVRIIHISPGAVKTSLGEESSDRESLRALRRRMLNDGLAPSEVAHAVVKAISDPNSPTESFVLPEG